MPIDAGIYGAIQTPKQTNPLEQYAQMQQLQSGQNQNRLAELMFSEKQRESAGDNELAKLLAAGKTPQDVAAGLAGAGYGRQSMAYTKAQQDAAKQRAEIDKDTATSKKTALEAANLALTQHRDMLNTINDPNSAKQWITAAYQNPDTKAIFEKMGPLEVALQRFDQGVTTPEAFAKWKQQASLNAQELVKYTTPDANAVLSANTSTENNKRTVGASYANAAAVRATADATRAAAGMQRDRDTEMKIADDYRAQSKDFKAVGDAYKQISATLDKATTSPAATLAAATKFMKLLDPGSVVRESELGMALAATGVFDRASNYFNTLQRGQVLTESQAKDFKNITAQIYGAAQAGQKQIDESYKQQAKTYGLRPEMIVQDLGQNTPAAAPAQAPSALPKGWSVKVN